MVYDGAVKDQESSSGPASAALSEASGASAAASEALVSARPARPAQDRRLGVRHPLKYRRFRAGGKMTVEPGGLPSSQTVVQGEEEEEESSEVEEVEEEASSAEMQMQPRDVEVSSAPAQVVEEMAEVVEEMEVEGSEMDVSPEAAVAVGDTELEAQPDEEEEVSSVVVAEGDRKQEASAAASVPAVEAPNEKDQEKGREEKEREKQKERERVDEVGYMSGGWKSADGSLSCGYSSFRGKRASMEDFYDIKSSKIDETQISLFGIFDGHGGSRAAEYLKEHLFENLMKHQEFMTDTKLAISETYKKTDSEFLDAERNSHRDDGSTASTAVLVGDHLYVANVGDSRAVISKAGKAIALSEDHKPNRSDERKRIEGAGGVVMWAGTWRVGGVLAMSRAFGNRLLKQFVIADPEIQEQEVNDELEFLIIASDGLWDVVPNEDAVSLVKMEEEPEAAARKLTETAFSRGSGDNITCIVVKFQHDKMGGDSPPSGD
ncbi:probable protein phosphatase 2C 52 isoform X1 [Phragmites australis]|uniref:probable protein phosphatase 2C 52 isoform X1 n=1 Tax=Phragmites australis TaxID=29695 RepID=UPI002D796F9C|nr:probable protein phosphatase 2C 52 isoform X1 [Phragmites australis]XP_062180590.1 probable protein phosphatase 2C 52 isoform X1 [Phragmites australis]